MFHHILEKLLSGEDLTRTQIEAALEACGALPSNIQLAGLLTALDMKGMTKIEREALDNWKQRQNGAKIDPGKSTTQSDAMILCSTERLVAAQMIVANGEDLARREADAAMEDILSDRAQDVEVASFLTALRFKGETVDELVAFATVMRRHAPRIFADGHPIAEEALVDTCGTGGDALGTFNVSTATAFVVAGAGVRVAKHGNRSHTSLCGSADVLEQLGMHIDLPPERVARAIEQVGIGFLFAPAMHSATRHVAKVRRELGIRTVFNLLGPLTNPARASAQVVGVYDAGATELMAHALGELGVKRAFVVHGEDGLDEISISGKTYVSELRDGAVRNYTVTPEDFGVARAPLTAIRGGDQKRNSEIIRRILGGAPRDPEPFPHRDIALANASAALVAAGRAADFREGVRIACESIDSGSAREKLENLIAFSQREDHSPKPAP